MTRTCAALLCALCLAACSDEPTEVIITIRADAQVERRSSRLLLQIVDNDGASNIKTHNVSKWPFRLALRPRGGDAAREYRVTAQALDDDRAVDDEPRVIATEKTAGEFDEGKRQYVDLLLEFSPDDAGSGGAGGGGAGGRGMGGSDAAGDGAVDAGPDGATADAGGEPPVVCDAGDGGCAPRLLDLSVSHGELAPAFDPNEMQYAVNVSFATESIDITALAPPGANLSINGETVDSGVAWPSDLLAAGVNPELAIEVADADDAAERTSYALTVTRGAQQAYVKASDSVAGHDFGGAVAISGDTMVVGAESPAGGAGAAYVFVRDGTTGVWSEQQRLQAINAGMNDHFGFAVAISGDTIVVGAPLEDSSQRGLTGSGNDNAANDSGAAYVFVRVDGVWSHEAYLKADNTTTGDWFGWSVAIAGNTIAVGAFFEDGSATSVDGPDNEAADASGAAYVFARNGSAWTQEARLKPLNNGAGHHFGTCVAVDTNGSTVAVGAPDDDKADTSGRGSAYVFDRMGGSWRQAFHVKAGMPQPGEAFGRSVAMSQGRLAVGTTSGMNLAPTSPESGAVHVFERVDGFTMGLKLTPDIAHPGDEFGHAVAIDGNYLLVGAPLEAGSVRGVHAGAPLDNAATSSGAAYVFERRTTSWAQLAYLKASNADSSDRFGWSVAISEGSLVVGAIDEASNATGVNSGTAAEADNSAASSGAAYLFR